MDGPAWVVAIEFCNQLICDGRAGRLSDGESLAASRNALRECARRFKVGVRSISRREAAGKKLAMGLIAREGFEPGMVETAKGSE
jgi:hypothetical protein